MLLRLLLPATRLRSRLIRLNPETLAHWCPASDPEPNQTFTIVVAVAVTLALT